MDEHPVAAGPRAATGEAPAPVGRMLTSPSSPLYRPMWGPIVVVETTINVAFLVGAGVLLFLFFQKRPA